MKLAVTFVPQPKFMATRALTIISLFFILSCSKDKLETKPSINVKSVSSNIVIPGSVMRLIIEFNDKEGDLGQGEVSYIRERTNIRPIPGGFDKADTVRYPIPEFPDRSTGEIEVNIPYDFLDESPNDSDTMFFKISVVDRGGNKSDTIQTSQIIARQN